MISHPSILKRNENKTDAGQLVKSAEELVEEADQLLGCALRREDGEAHDVGEKDADVLVAADVDLVELTLYRRHDVGLHLDGNVLRQH